MLLKNWLVFLFSVMNLSLSQIHTSIKSCWRFWREIRKPMATLPPWPQRLNAQRMRLVSVYCKKELVSEQGLDVVATTANVQLNWAVTVFNAFFGWYEEQRPGGAAMTCCVQWSVHPCVQASIGGQRMHLYQVTFTFYPEQNILTSSKLAPCPHNEDKQKVSWLFTGCSKTDAVGPIAATESLGAGWGSFSHGCSAGSDLRASASGCWRCVNIHCTLYMYRPLRIRATKINRVMTSRQFTCMQLIHWMTNHWWSWFPVGLSGIPGEHKVPWDLGHQDFCSSAEVGMKEADWSCTNKGGLQCAP